MYTCMHAYIYIERERESMAKAIVRDMESERGPKIGNIRLRVIIWVGAFCALTIILSALRRRWIIPAAEG